MSIRRGRNDGDFDSRHPTAVQAIIADPEFVFRFERTPANVAPGRTIASAIWSWLRGCRTFCGAACRTIELITLASQGKLQDPAVLEQQVRRMLADPKSEALATNFAGQWLYLQNLKDVQPDAFLFPNFDENLAESMRRETELFFDSIVREDRNVLDLLTANYTFVDERLAKALRDSERSGQPLPARDARRMRIAAGCWGRRAF